MSVATAATTGPPHTAGATGEETRGPTELRWPRPAAVRIAGPQIQAPVFTPLYLQNGIQIGLSHPLLSQGCLPSQWLQSHCQHLRRAGYRTHKAKYCVYEKLLQRQRSSWWQLEVTYLWYRNTTAVQEEPPTISASQVRVTVKHLNKFFGSLLLLCSIFFLWFNKAWLFHLRIYSIHLLRYFYIQYLTSTGQQFQAAESQKLKAASSTVCSPCSFLVLHRHILIQLAFSLLPAPSSQFRCLSQLLGRGRKCHVIPEHKKKKNHLETEW